MENCSDDDIDLPSFQFFILHWICQKFFCIFLLFIIYNSSMEFLTKLERLDFGCNELEELVSSQSKFFSVWSS